MKKLFTLLMLLLCVGGGKMWADTFFGYTMSSQDNTAGTYDATGTFAGTVQIGVGSKYETGKGVKFDGDSGNKYAKVTLTQSLQTGDKITLQIFTTSNPSGSDYGVSIGTEAFTAIATATAYCTQKNTLEDIEITVPSTLNGKTEFYLFRVSGKSTYLNAITITGTRTATVAPSALTFSVDGGSVDGDSKTTIASTNAMKIFYYWSESSEAPSIGNASYTEANGTSYEASVPSVNGTRYLHAYAWNNYNTNSYTAIKSATFSITTLANSDLAVASGKGTINTTVGADNYTLTSGTDFTTSSDGTLSFTSSIPGVAYVNPSSGEIQFMGVGTTTITLSQAAGSLYKAGEVSFTVNVLPTACLNLGDKNEAITQLKKGWSYDSPYFDVENRKVIISAYAAYSSANQGYQKWIGMSMNTDGKSDPSQYVVGGTSIKASWSGSTPFIGGAGYYRDDTNPRHATTNSSRPWTTYKFRVKGITTAQARVKGNNASRYVSISAYEITEGALASSPVKSSNSSDGNETTISVNELNSSKEYLIVVGNTVYASNLNFYEIAFTASASDIEIPSNRITTSAAGWASYSPMYNVSSTIYKPGSSSGAGDITIYAISSVDAGVATMAEVTAGTEKGMKVGEGYFLRGAANTVYRTTATNGSVVAPAANLIKGQISSGIVKSDASNIRYALLTYDEDNYGLYKLNTTGVTIPAGKAYLEVGVDEARSFDFLSFLYDADNQTTDMNVVRNNILDTKEAIYNLNGQRVNANHKGLIIVNGKKIFNK